MIEHAFIEQPPVHHPDTCGPCEDCAEALEDYGALVAERRRPSGGLSLAERRAYWAVQERPTTFGYGYETTLRA